MRRAKVPARVVNECLHKVGHPTRLAARMDLQRQPAKVRQLLDAYRCKTCGLWHIGHGQKARQRVPRWLLRQQEAS